MTLSPICRLLGDLAKERDYLPDQSLSYEILESLEHKLGTEGNVDWPNLFSI